MKLRKKFKCSLLMIFLVPFTIIMAGQAVLFYSVTLWGGTIQQVINSEYDLLDKTVAGRKSYIENEMVHRWSNIDETVDKLNTYMNEEIAHYGTVQAAMDNDDLVEDFLSYSSEQVLYTLRKNMVTGAFVVLDNPRQTETGLSRPGVYIGNSDPNSAARDNSDLIMRRGPSNIYRKLSITTDISWTPMFTFTDKNSDFFEKPKAAALRNPHLPISNMGYWCENFSFSEDSHPVITYSVPLMDKFGNVYGVAGIEISPEYLVKLLPYRELTDSSQGLYCFGVTRDGGNTFNIVASSGSTISGYIPYDGHLSILNKPVRNNVYKVNSTRFPHLLADINYLRIYNPESTFNGERWALIGMLTDNDLLRFPNTVNHNAIVTTIISVSIGIMLTFLIFRIIAKPIYELIGKLRASNPNNPVVLGSVNITEIDELSETIEEFSTRVSEASSMLSRIVKLSDVHIAAFELDISKDYLTITDGFFPIIGIPQPESSDTITGTQFKAYMESKNLDIYEVLPHGWVVQVNTPENPPRWVRITLTKEKSRVLGVAVDVTEQTISKQRVEHERDHDILTNLLNRRAFLSTLNKLLENPDKVGISAMVLLDLDNLKFINDSYGHDYGDGYIQATANALRKTPVDNIIVSRMAGDEFYVFVYGYSSKGELREIIKCIHDTIASSYFVVPGAEAVKIRCSAGVAWYPEDTDNIDELVRYADFAMYTAKNTKKGDFCEFDLQSYNQKSFLLHSREDLNKLIDGCLVNYSFQPIVDARTGKVFAYEALMRSTLETLKSPLEVLALARTQSKLYDIERVTWFTALKQAKSDTTFTGGNFKLFINSVSNQMLTSEDVAELEDKFGSYLHRIVLEVTEEEKFTEDLTVKKQKLLYSWGGEIALDDFGTGYNGDTALLLLTPNYVKIDMSIVRNIDTDTARQGIFSNLVSYSKERNIKVIAEGVETVEELETLISLGVDYLQGYFLGKPDPKLCEIPNDISQTVVNISNNHTKL